MSMENDNMYPSIVFDVAGNLFSVNSKYIDGIVQLQEYTQDASAKGPIRGMMQYRGSAVTLYELRKAMDMGSLEDEFDKFCEMIDARKGDHERWVAALEETARTGAPFTLATDPHKCALGKWRDAFESDIDAVNFQLSQLDVPHASLHKSAEQILGLWKEGGDDPANHKAIMAIYEHVRDVYMPSVLSMLEEIKHLFRGAVFREMVLLLNVREHFGVIVENIHSVEHLTEVSDASLLRKFAQYSYITSIQKSDKLKGLIANIDMGKLLEELEAAGV